MIAALPWPAREAVHLARRLRFVAKHGSKLWRRTTQNAPHLSRSERVRHILAGFDPLEADWYLQAHGHVEGNVSNLHREEYLRNVNGAFGHVLDNKHLFALVAERLGIPHPRLFGFSHNGRWGWLDDGREALERQLASGGKAVLKPSMGKKGDGIVILRDIAELDRPAHGDMIVTAFVEQHDYAASIHPDSLNTIRILTVRPEPGADAFVAAAVHRFGGATTGAVDNFSAGGVVAPVDLESGELGRAAKIDAGNLLTLRDTHPDHQTRITGVRVPQWDSTKALVLEMWRMLPQLDYVGWDLAIGQNGPVVIEGNSHPSLRFFQLQGTLLDDPRMVAFLTSRQIAVARGSR